MTQPTSLAAYVDLCERRIITVRELEVVRTLALLPAATCSRCVWEAMKVHSITRHPIPQHSVNPRFATLARNGIVAEAGTHRCPYTGRATKVWRLTGHVPATRAKQVAAREVEHVHDPRVCADCARLARFDAAGVPSSPVQGRLL